jgi:spermidine synthase
MPDNSLVRRRTPRRAVHQAVGGGQAELVPDLSRANSWLLFIDGVPQSQVDLDDPGFLEFEYIRRIAHAIDLAFPPGSPVRALHLGGGAMTLPRYVTHTRPGSAQVVAETDALLTDLVRRQLPLPSGPSARGGGRIRVRAQDAREVLEAARPGGYDIVISDVYAGARTPFHLTTAQCAAAARRALRDGGLYAINVADGPPLRHARAQVATVGSAFPASPARAGSSRPGGTPPDPLVRRGTTPDPLVRRGTTPVPPGPYPPNIALIAEPGVLRGRRTGNLVLLASTAALPLEDLSRRVAADPFPARVVAGADLSRFAAGAAPVTDASVPQVTAVEATDW